MPTLCAALSRRKNSQNAPHTSGAVAAILSERGYRLGQRIGKGSYAKVKVAERVKDNMIVAVKIILREKVATEFCERFLPRELSILVSIRHPNIVRVFEVIQVKDTVCLITEYAERSDLLVYIRQRGYVAEAEATGIYRQICQAVLYLHSNCVCHRDLKCENVLLRADLTVALTDFGFAKMVDPVSILSKTHCGSTAYASPELLRGAPYDPYLSDVWSLGCILFILVTGRMPFRDSNLKKATYRQLSGTVVYPSNPANISNSCKQLISRCLEPNTERRYTAAQILNHSWSDGSTSPCLDVTETTHRSGLSLCLADMGNSTSSRVEKKTTTSTTTATTTTTMSGSVLEPSAMRSVSDVAEKASRAERLQHPRLVEVRDGNSRGAGKDETHSSNYSAMAEVQIGVTDLARKERAVSNLALQNGFETDSNKMHCSKMDVVDTKESTEDGRDGKEPGDENDSSDDFQTCNDDFCTQSARSDESIPALDDSSFYGTFDIAQTNQDKNHADELSDPTDSINTYVAIDEAAEKKCTHTTNRLKVDGTDLSLSLGGASGLHGEASNQPHADRKPATGTNGGVTPKTVAGTTTTGRPLSSGVKHGSDHSAPVAKHEHAPRGVRRNWSRSNNEDKILGDKKETSVVPSYTFDTISFANKKNSKPKVNQMQKSTGKTTTNAKVVCPQFKKLFHRVKLPESEHQSMSGSAGATGNSGACQKRQLRKVLLRSQDIALNVVGAPQSGSSSSPSTLETSEDSSEQFLHVKEEGLVAKRRRVFESKDVGTNT